MCPKYDFKCPKCDEEFVYQLTYREFHLFSPPSCPCGSEVRRIYNVVVPKSTQMKGHYNGSYEAHKETTTLLKNGGENVDS